MNNINNNKRFDKFDKNRRNNKLDKTQHNKILEYPTIDVVDKFSENNSFFILDVDDSTNNTQIKNLIYNIKINDNLLIKDLNLIKKITIENTKKLKNRYDYGIVIPTYNRSDYLQHTLNGISISNLSVFDILFIIFDDGSENIETIQLIENFNLQNIPIIKIFTNRINLNKTENGNTFLPGSCFPYSLRFGYEIAFCLNSEYVINLDSDAIVCHDWLIIINNFFLVKDLPKLFILSGFNDINTHKFIESYDEYNLSKSFGGINIIFNKMTFYEIIYNLIYDFAYDWIISNYCAENNIPIFSLKTSIVQHIGFETSIIRGIENIKNFSHENYLTTDINKHKISEDIHQDKLRILRDLADKAKSIIDCPKALDYKLERTITIFDKIVDRVFIINIKNRKDRLNNIIKHLYYNNITNIERFDAVVPIINIPISLTDYNDFINGLKTDVDFFQDFKIETYKKISFEWIKHCNHNINYIKGALGCKSSHIKIIEEAKKRNYKSILILEDDICFIKNWEFHLNNSINILNDNYDFLYLTNNHAVSYEQINDYIVKPIYGLQTGGYIIKNTMYDHIINNAMNSGQEIDVFYSNTIQNNINFKVFTICPNIINQIESYSSIENRVVSYSSSIKMNTIRKIDIIYVCHSKDKQMLIESIQSVFKFAQYFNKIYLISKHNFLLESIYENKIVFIDESLYPFNIDDIINNLPADCPSYKYGWYYQQLLKLYAKDVLANLTEHYLVIDSDVIFLNFINFFNEDNIPYFTLGNEYNKPYFDHMELLLPGLQKQHVKSGISHHMIFNINILSEMINRVEKIHGEPFWKSFLRLTGSFAENNCRASEYEIYFSYVLKYYPSKYIIRELPWKNSEFKNSNEINNTDMIYIAFHDWYFNDYTKYEIE